MLASVVACRSISQVAEISLASIVHECVRVWHRPLLFSCSQLAGGKVAIIMTDFYNASSARLLPVTNTTSAQRDSQQYLLTPFLSPLSLSLSVSHAKTPLVPGFSFQLETRLICLPQISITVTGCRRRCRCHCRAAIVRHQAEVWCRRKVPWTHRQGASVCGAAAGPAAPLD